MDWLAVGCGHTHACLHGLHGLHARLFGASAEHGNVQVRLKCDGVVSHQREGCIRDGMSRIEHGVGILWNCKGSWGARGRVGESPVAIRGLGACDDLIAVSIDGQAAVDELSDPLCLCSGLKGL